MEPSADPGTDPVLGEGHYTVVLAGAGHRTLEVTRAGPGVGFTGGDDRWAASDHGAGR